MLYRYKESDVDVQRGENYFQFVILANYKKTDIF